MLFVFILLKINLAFGLTLESKCELVSLSGSGSEVKVLDSKKCVDEKLKKYFLENADKPLFFVKGRDKNIFYGFFRKNYNAYFCKIPGDEIIQIDLSTGKSKSVWNSEKNFSKILNEITNEQFIIMDTEKTKDFSSRTCLPFPAISRVKTIEPNLFPFQFKELQSGGYALISERLNSLFFMDNKLNKIVHTMTFPFNVTIKDIQFSNNGDLYVLSNKYSAKLKSKRCVDRWDVATETLLDSNCELRSYHQHSLLKINGNIRLAHMEKNDLIIEDMNEKNLLIVRKLKKFNLQNAVLEEN